MTDLRQAIKELRDQYLEEADSRYSRSMRELCYRVASDLDNILLVRCPARSGAASDSKEEGKA